MDRPCVCGEARRGPAATTSDPVRTAPNCARNAMFQKGDRARMNNVVAPAPALQRKCRLLVRIAAARGGNAAHASQRNEHVRRSFAVCSATFVRVGGTPCRGNVRISSGNWPILSHRLSSRAMAHPLHCVAASNVSRSIDVTDELFVARRNVCRRQIACVFGAA